MPAIASSSPLLPSPLARAASAACIALAAWTAAPVWATVASGPQVAWQAAAADVDIEKAFAQGKAEGKPVLVYWGAKWCPPCNQLKATLFNRQDFIERSKSFVAVSIDGDLPGAQKLGARFKVRGYPTMILFNTDGAEITRLPGEADAPAVMNVLQMGLAGGRPVKTVLAEAKAGKPVSANEWRMLAFYSWDTDEAQLVPEAERAPLLAQLAGSCPVGETETATRLLLKALVGQAEIAPNAKPGIKVDGAVRDRVKKLLADPAATRSQMDVVVNFAPDLAKALAPTAGADRQAIVGALDAALVRLQGDASLSRADRMSALIGRVDLARLEQPKDTLQPKLPEALIKQVREEASRADKEVTEGYERQAVITSAAHLLGEAGLWKDSDALLQASLPKSHSPYYLMSQLSGNAKKQGRKAEALSWSEQAFNKSEGPATRLQWGASYVAALVELAPQDEAKIERTVSQLIREADGQQGAFYERSARSMQKVGDRLAAWNAKGQHKAVVERLRAQLTPVCAKLPAADAQREACDKVLKKA
ncbi:MAG TPA: thioredoxin fold domain-containing protein [Ideonella sp.]|uniref:thioredoxin family protein n=1 Tax=Ideonella sp. TaxID=1929293 RepID=UPI002E377A17|nr:thioredoxin fold domain-containing protein [Ideonella sp.]HEX5686942.1 thioredoxin fold domain-containing protein [Ideonella sp.]